MEHPFFKYFYTRFVAFAFDCKCILDDQMRILRCSDTTHRFLYLLDIFKYNEKFCNQPLFLKAIHTNLKIQIITG